MKKWLCVLIASTCLGSSFILFEFSIISIYAFRLVLLLFLVFFFVSKLTTTKNTKINYPFINKYKIYLMYFTFFTLITIANAPDIATWFNGCIFLATNIAIMYFIFVFTETEDDLRKYIYAYMFGFFVTMVVSIYEYHTGNHLSAINYTNAFSVTSWEFRALSKYPTAFLYNPNNIGVAMLISIGFGLVFLQQKRNSYSRILFFLWTALSIYVAFITGSRGSIVFILIGFFLTSLNTSHTFSRRAFWFITLFAVALVSFIIFDDFFWETLDSAGLLNDTIGQAEGDDTRWRMIDAAWERSLDTSFIGVGPRGAEATITRYYGYTMSSIHNFFPELLLTQGAGGFVTFLLFFIRCVRVQVALRSETEFGNLLLVSMIMFLFAGTIPPTIFTLHFIWIIFAFSLANEKLYYLKTQKTIR